MGKEAVAYKVEFDRKIVGKEEKALQYIGRQVETHLGERFNTLLSTFRFELVDGQIYGEDVKEPFLKTIKRGRDYRKIYGEEVDRRRENAEVEGFEKIQKVLVDPKTELGTVVLSISPRGENGSIYRHNFYDIFTLTEDEKGRYVEGRRYSSALSPVETIKRLRDGLNIMELPFPSDVSLLSNPIVLGQEKGTADEIHSLLHENHEYMNPLDFYHLKTAIGPFIEIYKEALLEGNEDFIIDSYDAVLNQSDKIWRKLESVEDKGKFVLEILKVGVPSRDYIRMVGSEPVRQVMTGCGSSGSASKDKQNNSIFRVSDFSEEWFTCPKCGYKADGPVGNSCPGCGITKEQYAAETGEDTCE